MLTVREAGEEKSMSRMGTNQALLWWSPKEKPWTECTAPPCFWADSFLGLQYRFDQTRAATIRASPYTPQEVPKHHEILAMSCHMCQQRFSRPKLTIYAYLRSLLCSYPLFSGTKERVGEHVTEVIPASPFGLLPAPLDAQRSVPTKVNQKFQNVLQQHDVRHAASSETPSEGIKEDGTVAAAEEQHVGEGRGGISTTASMAMLLDSMLHLFGHGTPMSLELELDRVGAEALRALRTPDVSIHGWIPLAEPNSFLDITLAEKVPSVAVRPCRFVSHGPIAIPKAQRRNRTNDYTGTGHC